MKNKSLIAFLVMATLSVGNVSAQDVSDSLSGTFQLSSGEGMYDAFVFDGAGKVVVHTMGEYTYDYFQIGDTVVIYPDKDIFIFLKKDNQTLVGHNSWINEKVYKKMENDTVIPSVKRGDPKKLALFYEYYILCGRQAPGLATYFELATTGSSLNSSMQKLCDEGLSKACLTMANAALSNSPGVMSSLLGTSKEKPRADKNVIHFYEKAMLLNDLEAYAQLGAYFQLIGDDNRANEVFEMGCELGNANCCIAIGFNDLEFDEEDDFESHEHE